MTLAKLLRITFAVLLVTVGVVALNVGRAQARTEDDWTTSLHDNLRDGASINTVISTTTAPNLVKRWSYATGPRSHLSQRSSAASRISAHGTVMSTPLTRIQVRSSGRFISALLPESRIATRRLPGYLRPRPC